MHESIIENHVRLRKTFLFQECQEIGYVYYIKKRFLYYGKDYQIILSIALAFLPNNNTLVFLFLADVRKEREREI